MYSEYLIGCSLKIPEVKCFQGDAHPLLMKMAEDHANYMAKVNTQGHQGFQKRFDEATKKGFGEIREICAESWEWEKELSEVAASMFESWKYSPGHWAVCHTECDYFGAAMAKGKRVWYACVIIGNEA